MLLLALTACSSPARKSSTPQDSAQPDPPAGDVGTSNQAPFVTIDTPENGATYAPGELVTVTARVSDDVDASEALRLAWTSDLAGSLSAEPSDAAGQATLTTANLAEGTHEITLTATDSSDLAASATVSVVIGDDSPDDNTPPPPTNVALAPLNATVATELTCTYDSDAEPATYEIDWVVNNASVKLGPATLPAAEIAQKGDSVLCRVRAMADDLASAPVDSNTVVVLNAPPDGGVVLIDPGAPGADDTLTCGASGAVDPDGDGVLWVYQWQVNGETVAGQTDETLSSEHFEKGDTVTCTATPTDGEASGPTVNAKVAVQIGNALPVVSGVTLSPAAGAVCDE